LEAKFVALELVGQRARITDRVLEGTLGVRMLGVADDQGHARRRIALCGSLTNWKREHDDGQQSGKDTRVHATPFLCGCIPTLPSRTGDTALRNAISDCHAGPVPVRMNLEPD